MPSDPAIISRSVPTDAGACGATASAAASSSTPAAAPLSFDGFGLAAPILRAIVEQGYTKPTPIQAQAIPIVLAGRDVMGAAQTGTGKTASFSLPIIQRLLPLASTSASPARHPVRALILTPTRELADQVAANVHAYAKHTPLRSAVVFGGVDMNPQTAALRRGVEILIATPGRLLDHVQQKSTSLAQVQMLVLDEADRMLDMGFLPDLQRILNLLPGQRQTLLFSATFSAEIKKLASTYLRNPVTIEVARSNSTASNVRQIVFEVAEPDKPAAVVQLIRQRELKQVIVFCNSKIGASRLARQLERDGVVATAIHGDRSQSERMQALDAFKRGEIEALVATDVAARGLDIAELPAVINFDLPFNAEDYVHRIGRTGRAGASGDALSLFSGNERKQLADIEKLIKRALTIEPLELERPARQGRSRYRDDRDDSRRDRHAHVADRVRASMRDAQPVDDFFTKPYEPSSSARQTSEREEPSPSADKKTPKRPLAALLGGFGMPRRNS
ncbi:DEAD/DEAH box helicase [Mycetohabitans sp. B5]|uniref:DEAD-box ATP-dependent RNA helicase RhpA n=1 Tax=Mycetohabitans endofungorum TaxID=417203 RepID=A0A2P5KC72_9BURK|nr:MULTISPECIES: DEAD/DEAH box helicase [Mycetohabitans]MCG1055473.1 DEAD/DEAH box helicase [Mycetohabitans sp. B5]PPB84317.1 superfamily II DNA/RNA helicase [Mycetohabitans endofungorum]